VALHSVSVGGVMSLNAYEVSVLSDAFVCIYAMHHVGASLNQLDSIWTMAYALQRSAAPRTSAELLR